jgi:predicted NUDIX family NTP pyrophosphohydrolase
MAKSAGILIYRQARGAVEVLLAHPGGPYWRRKDAGAWSIPKGEIGEAEDELAAAIREVAEETGITLAGAFAPLGEVRQAGGKRVAAWAHAADLDPAAIRSNSFALEWPPKSGRLQEFPEIDRAQWFDLPTAHGKILQGQRPFLDRLAALIERSAVG